MDNTNAGNESISGESDSNDLPKSPVESSQSADMFSAILGLVGDIATDLLKVSPAAETLSQTDIDEITDDIKDFVGSAEVRSALDQEFRREQTAKGSEQTVGFDDAHVDFDAVHPIKRVLNEEAFMRWLFEHVSDDSVWVIDHELEENQVSFLRQFEIEDDIEVASAAIYPPRGTLKIRLDKRSKAQIIARLPDLGIGWEIVHQHVYSVKHFYLTTYDCFSYVGLSLEVPTKEIQHLEAAQILILSG